MVQNHDGLKPDQGYSCSCQVPLQILKTPRFYPLISRIFQKRFLDYIILEWYVNGKRMLTN